MKRLLITLGTVAAVAASLFTGCTKDVTVTPDELATVSIERLPSDTTECKFSLKPSENATYFYYLMSETDQTEAFLAGEAAGIMRMEGNQPSELVFEKLDPKTTYHLYAIAYDEAEKQGVLATVKFRPDDGGFKVEQEFVLKNSAAIKVKLGDEYKRIAYYFGKPEDRQAFIDGSLEILAMDKIIGEYTFTYYDLQPDTEYAFFVVGYNILDIPTELNEVTFRTPAEGAGPEVTLTTDHSDIYRSNFTLTPNEHCFAATAYVCDKGYRDELIYHQSHFKGDVMGMLYTWQGETVQSIPQPSTEPLPLEFFTPALQPEFEIEILALLFDENLNPIGVQRILTKTPAVNPNAVDPKTISAEIVISDIYKKGATYTITPSENAFAIMYDTVDGDWYDDIKETSEYYETLVNDEIFKQGRYWSYTNKTVTFTEKGGKANTKYYAAACPMNENGPLGGGWAAPVLVSYTTTNE